MENEDNTQVQNHEQPSIQSQPFDNDFPIDDSYYQNLPPQAEMDVEDLFFNQSNFDTTPIPEPYFNQPPINDLNGEEIKPTPLSNFLEKKFAEKNFHTPNKNYSLATTYPKNEQSNWFSEFNKEQAQNNTPQNSLICKANGYFYNESEKNAENALIGLGFSPDQAKLNADKFDFAFIGNTQTKSKKNPNDVGFKSYALVLKDPNSPDALNLLNQVKQSKEAVVESKLAKAQNLTNATEKLLQNKDRIVAEHMASTNTKKPPFIGVGDNLFLDSASVRSALSEIPELKGKYVVKSLQAQNNSEPYYGKSQLLDSYFNTSLSLNEVKTKNEKELPQADLERIFTEHVERNPQLQFNKTPIEAMTLRDPSMEEDKSPKQEAEQKAPTQEVKQNAPTQEAEQNAPKHNATSDSPKGKFNDNDQKYQAKDTRNSQDQEQPTQKRKTLAENILNSATDLTANVLKLALELVKRILMMLLALLLVLFKKTRLDAKITASNAFKPIQFSNKKDDKNPSPNNKQNVASNELRNEKIINNHNQSIEKKNALEKALGNINLTENLDQAKAKTLTQNGLVSEHLLTLDQKEQDALKQKAINNALNMTDAEKQNILKNINAPSLHTPLPNQPLPDLMHVDDKFGILLAKNDLVKDKDGNFYGVLDAQKINNELIYTTVKQNNDGNYDISFKKADELTLSKPNGVKFDNVENLSNQAKEFVKEQQEKLGVKAITPVSLLDRNNLDEKAINPIQYAQKNNILPIELLSPMNLKKGFDYLINRTNEYKQAKQDHVIHLHKDSEPSIAPKEKAIHSQFGLMLGVNDLVALKDENDKKQEATVLRAYESKGDLHYLVLNDDKIQSIPAKELELIGSNKGQLTPNQIKDIQLEQSEVIPPLNLPREHLSQSSRTQAIDLNISNNLSKENAFTATASPLQIDRGQVVGANTIVSVLDPKTNEQQFYVTLGQTEKDKNKVIALEIEQNALGGFDPKPNSSLSEINMKDYTTMVIHNKTTEPEILSVTDIAIDNYKQSLSNATESLHNSIKDKEIEKCRTLTDPVIANEYSVANLSALHIVNKANEAITTAPDDQLVMGATANLANTTFTDDLLKERLNEYSDQLNADIANAMPPLSELSTVENLMATTPSMVEPTPVQPPVDVEPTPIEPSLDNFEPTPIEPSLDNFEPTPVDTAFIQQHAVLVDNSLITPEPINESTLQDPEINTQKFIDSYKEKVDIAIQEQNNDSNYLQVAMSYITEGQVYPQFAQESIQEFGYLESYKNTLDQRMDEFKHEIKDFLVDVNKPDFLEPSNIKNFDLLNDKMNNKNSIVYVTYDNLKMSLEAHKSSIGLELDSVTQTFAELRKGATDNELTNNITEMLDAKLNKLNSGYEKYHNVLDNASALKQSQSLDQYKAISNEISLSDKQEPKVSINAVVAENSHKQQPKYEFNRGMNI